MTHLIGLKGLQIPPADLPRRSLLDRSVPRSLRPGRQAIGSDQRLAETVDG